MRFRPQHAQRPWKAIVNFAKLVGLCTCSAAGWSFAHSSEVELCETAGRMHEEPRLETERSSQCAWELGGFLGKERTTAHLEEGRSEIPIALLLDAPIPDLSTLMPGVSAISKRSDRSFQRGYTVGIFHAIDRAVSQGKHLPQGMLRSDLHRRKLALLAQWADDDLAEKNPIFDRLGVIPEETRP
jgi:hypothetical protein